MSAGGSLNDGYSLGRSLRKYQATTVIENGSGCASSCAVAFLGGARRIIEDDGSILFHAPYYKRQNHYGEIDPDCSVEQEAIDELKAYYSEMAGAEDGNRLFERTMWYCSAEDGWVVRGGDAAELYGIATE